MSRLQWLHLSGLRDDIVIVTAMRCEIPAAVKQRNPDNVPFKIRTLCCGIGMERTRKAVAHLVHESKPGLIIMTGFCGAVNDNLGVGDLIEAKEVRFESECVTALEDVNPTGDNNHLNKRFLTGTIETRHTGVLSRSGIHVSSPCCGYGIICSR
jgi:nucleoside phosphorylase